MFKYLKDTSSKARLSKNGKKKTEFPDIKSERLRRRQFRPDDIGNGFAGLSDPDVIKYYGISFDSLEATRLQMEWFAGLEKKGTGIWWAVCSPDNNIFFGAGGLNDLSKEHKKAEIGFWLLPRFWGQGIMGEAIPLICNYGFTTLALHRLEGYVDHENTNCKKALVKSDFIYEGTMRDCEIQNEKFISLDIYARLNEKQVGL